MIQYITINGEEYAFLFANRQLKRILDKYDKKLAEMDELLTDMDAITDVMTEGLQTGCQKAGIKRKVDVNKVYEWNEDGHLPFHRMAEIVGAAIKSNMVKVTDEEAEEKPDKGNPKRA